MHTFRPAAFVFVLLAAVSRLAAAEPLVVPIWPDKTPGDTGIEQAEGTRLYDSPILGEQTLLVTHVSRPTLTIYRPAENTSAGTAMIICPGGGYHQLFWELEGEEVAAWLNAQGIAGIILKYRCPRREGDARNVPPLGPQLDAQRAVSLVRANAREWGIDPQRIGMVGFSAGGHLAIATATGFEKRKYEPIDAVDAVSCRPDFAIACYSGYLKASDRNELSADIRIPEGTPPVFLAHTSDDKISDPINSVVMYAALQEAKRPVELHIFATGNHDFGVRQNGKLPSSWTNLCLRWLASQQLMGLNSPLKNPVGGAQTP